MTKKRLPRRPSTTLGTPRNDKVEGMDQTIILVDDKDRFKGYTTWREGHFGRGKRHRGFVVLLFDEAGNVYLQKRKHRVFDGLWDLTAISHPYKVAKKEESLEEAALRSLKNEMGIGKVKLKNIGAFVYFAKDGQWCENEYCHVLVGKFDGKFKPSKKYVYDAKKLPFDEFKKEVLEGSQKFTPWAIKSLKSIESVGGIESIDGNKAREFEEDLEKFKKEFSSYAKGYFEKKAKLVKKQPGLIKRFYSELEDFGQNGKAIRPYLVGMGYRIAGLRSTDYGLPKILPVCLAVELVHSFLLIHDDIIDRSDLRRGNLTIHKRFEKLHGSHYGMSQAMLLGDLAFAESLKLIDEFNADKKKKDAVVTLFLDVILTTIWGEALDVEYSFTRANIEQIWEVCDLKTARYSFVGPMQIGALLGGATSAQIQAIERFGILVGRAYQLRDDVMGVFGAGKVMGKSNLNDIRDGKSTVLIYKGLELANQSQRQLISRIWGNPKAGQKDLEVIKKILTENGALDWAEKELLKLVEKAGKEVGNLSKNKELAKILLSCAQFVAQREQ